MKAYETKVCSAREHMSVRSTRLWRLIATSFFPLLALSMFSMSASNASEGTGRQALTTSFLKVCADPANLPYSNKELEGFENKIIALVAEELGLEVRYTWFPQTIGFVRNTLRMRECDLISGITTTSELVQNTNPYYHSAYSMLYRSDSGLTATSMTDPQLRDKKLGVVAGTPPANIIAQLGLLGSVKPYHLVSDTRLHVPVEEAISDLANGTIDVAFLWGPIAAFYANQIDTELTLVPLVNEDTRTRLSFRVSMAVRYNETDWKHKINEVIEKLRPDINRILREYHIPLLNDRGELLD